MLGALVPPEVFDGSVHAPWGHLKVDFPMLPGPEEVSDPHFALLCNFEGIGTLLALPAQGRSGAFLGGEEGVDLEAEGRVRDGSWGNASACGAPASLTHFCIQIPHGDHRSHVRGSPDSVPILPLLVAFASGLTTHLLPVSALQWKKLTWFSHVICLCLCLCPVHTLHWLRITWV